MRVKLPILPTVWKVISIKKIAIKVTDGEHATPKRTKTGILLLSARNVQNGFINLDEVDFIPEYEYERIIKRCHPQEGDILVSCSGAIGRVCLVPKDLRFTLVRSAALIKPIKNIINPHYLMYSLQGNILQNQIHRSLNKSAQPNLFLGSINKLKIPLPPLEEQRKIAEILSTWDKATALTEKLIAAKQKLKKGLVQKLFDNENWELTKVGNVTDSIVPGRDKPKRFDGHIPWITTPDIDSENISISKNNLAVSLEELKRCNGKLIPSGSIIMNCVGEFGIVAINSCDIVINQQLHAFIPHKKIDASFLLYALKKQKRFMLRYATTTSVAYLNKDNCESIPIPIPPIEEQKKITEILTTVEKNISYIKELLIIKQKQKRGLMQKLLTGEWRVNTEQSIE